MLISEVENAVGGYIIEIETCGDHEPCSRFSLFWDVTQPRLVVTDVSVERGACTLRI